MAEEKKTYTNGVHDTYISVHTSQIQAIFNKLESIQTDITAIKVKDGFRAGQISLIVSLVVSAIISGIKWLIDR